MGARISNLKVDDRVSPLWSQDWWAAPRRFEKRRPQAEAETLNLQPIDAQNEKSAQDADAALMRLFLLAGVKPERINAAVLDTPRHSPLWADRLIAEGEVQEAELLCLLAAQVNAGFTTAPPALPQRIPASEAFAQRSYPSLREGEEACIVLQPDAKAMRALLGGFFRKHSKNARILLTTKSAFLDVLLQSSPQKSAKRAASTLPALLSARRVEPLKEIFTTRTAPKIIIVLILVNLLLFGFAPLLLLIPLLLSPIFVIASLSALRATWQSMKPHPAAPPLSEVDLPHYTILVPLYNEADIVQKLIERMAKLTYPREKLDIFFLVEEDDTKTKEAFSTIPLPNYMSVLKLPRGEPKTKPRALNLALPYARGECLVVYDAEDAPEADQLLKAAAQFAASPLKVACLQARLGVSNAEDGLLTHRFAVDYASLFDCIKAGMARLGWPVPLGGTSNHFRVSALRNVGAWDAWNVTEDADLGLRLARFGWQVGDLASTTWEEAPNTLSSWLNQRTRWLKGWFQTLLVHSRRPKRAVREFGAVNSLIITSFGVAFLIGALFQPFFILALVYRLLSNMPLLGGGWLLDLADSAIILSLLLATLSEVVPAFVALYRRKAYWLMPYILLAPITHILIFIAAWRALYEWQQRPFHWHKTQHGLAKHDNRLA